MCVYVCVFVSELFFPNVSFTVVLGSVFPEDVFGDSVFFAFFGKSQFIICVAASNVRYVTRI